MKDIKKTDNFNDKEWAELASLLSDENSNESTLLNQFSAEDTFNTAKQWKELRQLGSKKEINIDEAWNKVNSRMLDINPTIRKTRIQISVFTNPFLKVAALILAILCLGTAILYMSNPDFLSNKILVATSTDQKNVKVALPDGSIIYLNRNSEFIYRSNFGKRSRNVKLTGEAFFEISPDNLKPFIIDAGNAKVKVVGTTFNVITKNSESAVEVYVKTGHVMLSDNSGARSILLDPEYVGVIESKKTKKSINNNPNYLSWNTGLLKYDGQKLGIVLHDLKRVYNMDIVADDPSILENTWTSPIDNQSQETIIRLICASFNLSYSKDGSVYHLAKK
jgi:transmembrane sensor